MTAAVLATILIVEDDPGIAELEKSRLEDAGYAIRVASAADEALEEVRRGEVDLILLDYRLPGNVDGLEFHARVRAAGFDLPVILVTGFSNEATVIRALRSGVRDFVTKSIEYLDYLPEAVGRVLRTVQTENRLAESEARLAGIIASAKDAIIVTDADRRITLFNSAAEAMFRVPEADALGERLSRFIPDEIADGPGDGSATRRLRMGTRGVRADGQEFPLEATVSRGEAGGRRMYTVVVRDVTERKRAEDELRESQRLVQGIADAAPYVLYLLDLQENRVVYSNRQIKTVLGYSAEEFQRAGPGWFRGVIHPDDGGEFPASRSQLSAAADGEIVETEYRARHAGGEWRWLRSRDTVFDRDPAGRPRRVLGMARDITESKRAEARIREQAALLDQTNDAIMVRDLDNRILYWNSGSERLYGWTAAEAVGQDAGTFLYRLPAPPELVEARGRVVETGSWTGELRQVTRDGRDLTVVSHWTLLRDDDGRPKAALIINTDVTERKQLEAQYLHSQRMESIGTLAGGIAHDFNNLLTVINGYAEMLVEMARPDDQTRPILLEVFKAGERAAGLTRQLLAFSRKQLFSAKVFDLNHLVQEIGSLLRRLLGEPVELDTRLDPRLARIKADPGQVEQVIVNLAVNARDAMPGGGRLVIETTNVELDADYARRRVNVRPGRYVRLAVADTGVGMDEATLTRIFEPFFTTKEIGKGTGLGLSTVHGIVTQSGGHVDVRSEQGRGTVFEVYLPAAGDESGSADGETPLQVARGTETVLLVEDEAGVRGLARVALTANGYTVLEAANGQDALRVAATYAGPIHLLMTDVVMPRMNGRELAERLAADRPRMKVLYLSGHTEDAVLRHGASAAGTAFLQKPFTPAILARKIREVLDG